MGRPQKYYFKWGLFDRLFQNQIPEHVSRLWAFNLGPLYQVEGWGWTSERLADGRDNLVGWMDTGPNATKALAGGTKKMVLATPFYSHFHPVFAKSKTFRMLSIRIAQGPNAPTSRLLNFSDIEVLDFIVTDFSKMPVADSTGYAPLTSYASVFVKVHDPTVDVFLGVEFAGPLDHSKEKAEAAGTIRRGEFLEDLAKSIRKINEGAAP